jgi:hypothetical protein
MSKTTIVGLVLAILPTLLACDSSTDLPACETQAISSSLTRVMYWGRVSAVDDEPNKGTSYGDIRLPLWHADDKILVATARFDHGVLVNGIFDITVDTANSHYRGLSVLKFPNYIWAFEYLQDSGDFLITYPIAPNQPNVVKAHVVADELQISQTLYDSTWLPAAARALDDGSGAVVYFAGGLGRASGFYFVPLSPAGSDSLVLAETLSYSDGLGFDVAGTDLYYGSTIGDVVTPRTLVLKKSLTGGPATVVADLIGSFSGLSVNQDGTCILVVVQAI